MHAEIHNLHAVDATPARAPDALVDFHTEDARGRPHEPACPTTDPATDPAAYDAYYASSAGGPHPRP